MMLMIGQAQEAIKGIVGGISTKAQSLYDDSKHLSSVATHLTDSANDTVAKRIADKTNLLALNATIEAASAGEYGGEKGSQCNRRGCQRSKLCEPQCE